MVVVALTFFAWLVRRPQRHHRQHGSAHQDLGRQGQRPEHRRPHLPVGGAAEHRRPPAAGAGSAGAGGLRADPRRGLGAVRPEQRARGGVPAARHHGQRRRDRGGHAELAAAGVPEDPGVPDRQPVRPGQVPALAHVERRPSSICRRSRRSIASSCSARSCSAWSPPTSISPTRPSGSSTATSTSRSRSGSPPIIARNVVPDSAVTLSDAEITAYYKAHLDDFQRPATSYLSFVALPRLTDGRRHRGRARARRLGAGRDRGRRAVRRGGAARVRRQRQRGAGRRPGRVDPRQHGRRVRLGRVRAAAQHALPAGALAVRLST